MPSFIDRVVLHVAGGDGGNGCTSVHREKFKPLAGPDGGDGGHGGDVVLAVDPRVTTLLSYHRSPHQRAGNGTPGMGDWRRGTDGKNLVLPVPEGTVVKDSRGQVIADLVGEGTSVVVAQGGTGGRGNFSLPPPSARPPASTSWESPVRPRTSPWSSRPSPTSPWWATPAPASPPSSPP